MEFSQENQDKLESSIYKKEASVLLTQWYNELEEKTLSNLRKKMIAVGYSAPFLAFDGITGNVLVKRTTIPVYIADEGAVIYTLLSNGKLSDLGYRQLPGLYDGNYYIFATPNSPLIQVYPDYAGAEFYFYAWLREGRICECGNHFVDQYGEECPVCRADSQPLQYSARAEAILGFVDTESRTSFNKTIPKHLLFGLELEYEKVTAKQTHKLLRGHAIAKRDSTIRDGIEVVTRPASSETHKKMMSNFFDGVKTKANPNTGMHIHVAKEGLGEYRTGFLLWFMNNPDNTTFLTKVAGREYSSNTYCSPNAKYGMGALLDYDEEHYLKRSKTGKYSPLNTAKDHTYEFRIFRSPESHLEMAAKLDFVKALVEYSSPYVKVNAKSLKEKVKPEVFLQYIEDNRKDYPDFVKFFSGAF